MSAYGEVTVSGDTVTMTAQDFRTLITDLAAAEAERDALRAALDAERSTQDAYMAEVDALRRAQAQERAKLKRDKWLWGIFGAGLGYALQ